MKTLTLAMLVAKRACPEQRVLFKQRFGASVEITEELCVLNAGDFSFGWAMIKLLPAAVDQEAWDAVKLELAPSQAECKIAVRDAKDIWDIYRAQEKVERLRKVLLAKHFARAWLSLPEDYEP